jgi:tRNA pseudouridine55 synthase
MTGQSIDGVLVIDKPRGPTSHDVVFRVRRALRTRAVGHAGTLDPMATGVLVIALGEATKLVPWLTAHDKAYEAEVALGVETDTLDALGQEVARAPVPAAVVAALAAPPEIAVGSPALAEAFARERARTSQVPPVFSAIRTDGERSFARARRGEAPDLAPRPVIVHELGLRACIADPPGVALHVACGKGYYVRSLARDLARGLGTVGHLTSLRRTRSGCFTLDEAVAGDAMRAEELTGRLEPLARAAARALPVVHLRGAGVDDARHGRLVAADAMTTADPRSGAPGAASAWLDEAGALVAVGRREDDGRGRVIRGFAANRNALA